MEAPKPRRKRKVITYESWSKRKKSKRSAAASSGTGISKSIRERRTINETAGPGAQPTKSSKKDTIESEEEILSDNNESFHEEVWAEPVVLPEPVAIETWRPISSSTISTFKEIMESNIK